MPARTSAALQDTVFLAVHKIACSKSKVCAIRITAAENLHASVVTLQSQELLDCLQKTTDADINGATEYGCATTQNVSARCGTVTSMHPSTIAVADGLD